MTTTQTNWYIAYVVFLSWTVCLAPTGYATGSMEHNYELTDSEIELLRNEYVPYFIEAVRKKEGKTLSVDEARGILTKEVMRAIVKDGQEGRDPVRFGTHVQYNKAELSMGGYSGESSYNQASGQEVETNNSGTHVRFSVRPKVPKPKIVYDPAINTYSWGRKDTFLFDPALNVRVDTGRETRLNMTFGELQRWESTDGGIITPHLGTWERLIGRVGIEISKNKSLKESVAGIVVDVLELNAQQRDFFGIDLFGDVVDSCAKAAIGGVIGESGAGDVMQTLTPRLKVAVCAGINFGSLAHLKGTVGYERREGISEKVTYDVALERISRMGASINYTHEVGLAAADSAGSERRSRDHFVTATWSW